MVGDVSEGADGEIFLGIIQRASHKIEINPSAAMSKIKTGSQPLYLGQQHCQPEMALSSPLNACLGPGGRVGARQFFFSQCHEPLEPEGLTGTSQPLILQLKFRLNLGSKRAQRPTGKH